MNRRTLFTSTAAALMGGRLAGRAAGAPLDEKKKSAGLALTDFQPKSMLHVPETRVPRAKFPVIDIHTHLCWSAKNVRGVDLVEERKHLAPVSELIDVMDQANIRTLVNMTGGQGAGLRDCVERYDRARPGRLLTFTEPWWSRAADPGYAQFQADELARAKKDGARGLKLLKTLGLYLR